MYYNYTRQSPVIWCNESAHECLFLSNHSKTVVIINMWRAKDGYMTWCENVKLRRSLADRKMWWESIEIHWRKKFLDQ